MQTNATTRQIQSDPIVASLVSYLFAEQSRLNLDGAQLYYDFPLFKDYGGDLVVASVMVVSPFHGVIAIGTTDTARQAQVADDLASIEKETIRVFDIVYSKLLLNGELKRGRTQLKFGASLLIFAPNVTPSSLQPAGLETPICRSLPEVASFFEAQKSADPVDDDTFDELIATIEGSKGLIRGKSRGQQHAENSKGYLVNQLEGRIASFDKSQKLGYMKPLSGVERIRGLAGSGKTVVLAMKAALMHLRDPNAEILYTFWTKSLYQHIRNLVNRFYRQFDDRDPDWDRLHIMHGWGGYATEGVYFSASHRFGVEPLSYSQARERSNDPFGYACKYLLDHGEVRPMYDYVFVDEGQDFPLSFLQLCLELAKDYKFVYAYDELQTIFRPKAVSPAEFAPGIQLEEDIILYKCYRNPLEILVCAHAVGFGIYGPKVVQMLENKGHWEDVGYDVVNGTFTEGSRTVIRRPQSNSIDIISSRQDKRMIVQAAVHNTFDEEIAAVVTGIKDDIDQGLLPEDILVIVADDRNARSYITHIAGGLDIEGIGINNVHEDGVGLKNFQAEGCVTLSTIHKAKGNEAYMVYVVGVDALFVTPRVRERNMLFTAMTRAKAWLRVSGIGELANYCKQEIDVALEYCPELRFSYPSEADLNVMKRDLTEPALKKQQAQRKLDEIRQDMTDDEIRRLLDQRSIQKGS